MMLTQGHLGNAGNLREVGYDSIVFIILSMTRIYKIIDKFKSHMQTGQTPNCIYKGCCEFMEWNLMFYRKYNLK